MVRKEIFTFLDSYRRADATDLLYKWIDQLCPVILVRLIRWVCFPQLASVYRKNQLQQDLLMTFDLLDKPDLLHSKTKVRNDNDCDMREHLGYRRTCYSVIIARCWYLVTETCQNKASLVYQTVILYIDSSSLPTEIELFLHGI
jgi:hypothetical protein